MIQTNNVNLLLDCKNNLGEGPVWDYTKQELTWVDFDKGKIFKYNPSSGQHSFISVKGRVMVSVPTDKGNMIMAIDKKIKIVNPVCNSILKEIYTDSDYQNNRLNDGKCDALGRLWIGTMNNNGKLPEGNLYKINPDLSSEIMDNNFTIPNGIAWNKDNSKMYMVDSALRVIYQYDFNLQNGKISNKKILIETDPALGLPDGMSIDTDGNLWIAFWKGKCIGCVDSHTGKLLKKIKTPCAVPTSCCFGGENLSTLFITSSRKYDTKNNIKKNPSSGGLFFLDTNVNGYKANFFKEC